MKPETLRKELAALKAPFQICTTDGAKIYVDQPELIFITREVVVVGSAVDSISGIPQDVSFIAPEHIVRVESAKRRAIPQPA